MDEDVVDELQPYYVTWWAQADRKEPPAEVQKLYDQLDRRFGSNVTCFILAADGAMLRAFNGFPDNRPHPMGRSMKDMARYYVEEIRQTGAETRERKNDRRMPDVEDGVRVFVRLPDVKMFDSYRAPVVDVVADDGEWKLLAKPGTIDAAKLSRWLRLCYPTGINEQLKPYDAVEGTLTLTVDGILSGDVKMGTGGRTVFEGTFEAVVTRGERTTLHGVVDGTYDRVDRGGRRQEMRLTAAIESRPR